MDEENEANAFLFAPRQQILPGKRDFLIRPSGKMLQSQDGPVLGQKENHGILGFLALEEPLGQP